MAKKFSDLKINFLLNELLVFLIVQSVGLYGGRALFKIAESAAFLPPDENPFVSFSFLAAFFITTALYLFLIKKVKRKMPFRIFFSFLVFYGSLSVLKIWLPEPAAFGISCLIVFFSYQYHLVFIHDVSLMLATAGVGIILGIGFAPWQAVILLSVVSIYDFISVYKTKHMVEMFQGLLDKGVTMAAVIPAEFKGFFRDLREIKPGEDFLFIGTGDLAFPVIFSVAALQRGLWSSVLIILGASAGIVFLHFNLAIKKNRRPAPALPPIATGAILGFLVSLLLLNFGR